MQNKGPLLAALSGIFYGTLGWFGITIVEHGLSISTMLFWRFLLAAIMSLVLLPFFFTISWQEQLKLITPSFLLRLLVAVFFASISTLTYFLAAQKIGTGLGMVIYFCFPVLVVFLSWIFEQQRPSLNIMIAIVGIIVGCTLIANLKEQTFALEGILLAISSGLMYALYIFWNKKMINHVNSSVMTGLVCLGGCLVTLVIAGVDNSLRFPNSPDLMLLLLAMAFFATVLPSIFMLEATKFTSANLVSILAVFEPLVTLMIGMFILQEPTSEIQLIGAALVLASALLAQYQRKMIIRR